MGVMGITVSVFVIFEKGGHVPFKKFFSTSLALVSMVAALATAAPNADRSTPYDLIRPVWPLTWDTTVFDRYDTTVTTKHNMVPKNRTPAAYAPNEFIPDTLNQAYLDAINVRMSPIRVNQAGYMKDDPERQFYYIGTATEFEVVDINGNSLTPKAVGTFTPSGKQTSSSWTIIAGTNAATNDQKRYQVDITGQSGMIQIGRMGDMSLPEDTRLRIKVGNEISSTFIISERVYSMVRNAALKFYGINRSGDGESWFHPASHTKDGAGAVVTGAEDVRDASQYNAALEGTLQGGYYDCGDHLKESQTQMYAFMVAAVMAATNPDQDEDVYAYNQSETVNTDGIPDMLREAKHGADFVLRAYNRAKGVIDDMALSVGNFGSDHGWWGRPENQDKLPINSSAAATDRGGPVSRIVRLGEIGSNIGGETAAGLAILGKMYAEYDKPFADSCLMVAEKMYDFAKSLAQGKSSYDGGKPFVNNKEAAGWSSPAYNGNNEFYDDLALASVALLYATGKKEYADDMLRNKNMVAGQEYATGPGFFDGGWFVTNNKGFFKDVKNTSWANAYAFALYALYKLILADKNKALTEYGLTEAEWANAMEDCVVDMIANLGDMSYGQGTASIQLPSSNSNWKPSSVTYDPIWFTMNTDQTWIYNRYQAGNIFEVLAYADVTKDITDKGYVMPTMGSPDWKSDEMRQLGINQLNYLLGVNPWDVSYILGIGDKNDNHPHHRAANPEGKNQPGASYKYNPPVGALYGGILPGSMDYTTGAENAMIPDKKSWEDYHKSETCIDAAATLVSSGALAAAKFDRTAAPNVSVEIRHVSMDSAIVMVKLTTRGTVTIHYGTDENAMTETFVDTTVGMQHEMVMKPLQNGTTYYFYVQGTNAYNPANTTLKYLVENDTAKVPFSFTTLNTVENAEIANITVCNLTGDSAEIMWYTPNGEYESKIYWDTIPHNNAEEYAFNTGAGNADVAGLPTKFHYVKIGGLKEKTTYYYMVESNGVQQNVNDNGERLTFTTPVGWYDFSVRTYQYEFGGMDFLDANVYNNEARPFDSLTLRLYFTAKPEQVEKCATLIDSDICQAYDEAGFNKPCENDRELRDLLRKALPVRLEDTYNAKDGTYSYYFPAPLGSSTIKSQSRLRIDFGFSSGMSNDGFITCETLRQPGKKRFTKESGDWSWAPHKFLEDGADYDGMPVEDKDYGDIDNEIPVNQFITVYRKDEFIWGYSPSREEMGTKRAHYKIETVLDAPFNVSNGSYVQIDQPSSSTVYVPGHASISEQGYITKIWANGTQIKAMTQRIGNEIFMIDENQKVIAHYNITPGNGPIDSTGLWTLNIPVKMKVGSNKVDITIFAGPDPECEACTENGGCAFENRSYYVQFTRGDWQMPSMELALKDGGKIPTPADPSGTQFYINLKDPNNANFKGDMTVLVINSRKNDTLKVSMEEQKAVAPGTFKSPLITALSVPKNNKQSNQISFFPGDVIRVVYYYDDPELLEKHHDDEEAKIEQSFFAEAKYPEPQGAWALDTDCDNVADKLYVVFTSAISEDYSFDSVRVFLPGMADTATVAVSKEASLDQSEVTIDLPASFGIEANSSPNGSATIYLLADGAAQPFDIKIDDGIAPELLSVTILENPNHESPEDTLMIAFTEPVNLTSDGWPLDVFSETAGTLSIVGKPTTTNEGKSWMYVVTGNTNGEILKQGIMVSVKPGFVTDKNFNALEPGKACRSVSIYETPKPVPVTVAEMRDPDGDGVPSELYMQFEKKLRNKDMLDSFVVRWGLDTLVRSFITPADTSTGTIVPKGDWTIETKEKTQTIDVYDTDSASATYGTIIGQKDTVIAYSIITIKIASDAYPYGTTTGPDEGKGTVMPRLGPEGGFFDKKYYVEDLCPPVIVTAAWRELLSDGNELGSLDEVSLTLSEPVDTIAGHPYVVERNREGQAGVFYSPMQYPSLSFLYTAKHTEQRLDYRHKDMHSLWIGDSVRMISDAETGLLVDRAGNYPGFATPWIPITGTVSKVKFSIASVNPVAKSRSKDSVYYAGTPFKANENFRLTAKNKAGETIILASGDNVLRKENVDNRGPFANYLHAGPVFEIEAALPYGNTRDYDLTINLDIFSNMGSYVINTHYSDSTQYLKEFVSAGSTITFYLEWCAPEDAPLSADGRKIGTGPYIAKFKTEANSSEFPAVPESGDNDPVIKGSDTFTKTFGFKRVKQ